MKVFVYFNLHRKLWSVRNVKTGRVIDHTDYIVLTDVKFKVSQAGRQRVLREKKKNVHAGVQGYVANDEDIKSIRILGKQGSVTYNPYKYDSFVMVAGTGVFTADVVKMEVNPVEVTAYWRCDEKITAI